MCQRGRVSPGGGLTGATSTGGQGLPAQLFVSTFCWIPGETPSGRMTGGTNKALAATAELPEFPLFPAINVTAASCELRGMITTTEQAARPFLPTGYGSGRQAGAQQLLGISFCGGRVPERLARLDPCRN